MNDARGVANYFLDRASAMGMAITPMTLLKVLYFAHGWYMAKQGVELVGQPFEAWTYGPVNRVVYDQLKHLRGRPVTDRLKSFDAATCRFVETGYSFDEDTTKFLENVFDYYSQFHAYKLSELTHERGSPWDRVWAEAEKRAVPGMIISNQMIMEWFKQTGGNDGQTRSQRGNPI